MKLLRLCTLIVAALFCIQSYAETSISGYGSIIAGKTFGTVNDPINIGMRRDETFTADFYDVGQYTNKISFSPESIFAVQGVIDLHEKIKFTGQLVAKGIDDFQPELDWYYLTYTVNNDWSIMVGRRNLPMYYYSEFSEVGFAYPWIRPPANLYWWQVTQFNGVNASYKFQWSDLNHEITFFYGNEDSYDNKEMGFYEVLYSNPVNKVDEFWNDIVGVNWVIQGSFYDIRIVYFENDRNRTRYFNNGTVSKSTPFTQRFAGIGGSIQLDPFTILFDFNDVKYDDPGRGTQFPTYLLSLVYNLDQFQPFISYSKADHKRPRANQEDLEEHKLISIGFRYDLYPGVAFKIQYDDFVDQGGPGWDYHGDSRALAAGVDFVF